MDYQPKVSVVMSVYNGEKYLRETLDTVVNQTLKEIEIILVCNGSTDETLAIMEEYAAEDNRILVFPKEYAEAGAGRNYGLVRAKGKYVIFLDGDDLAEPELLKKTYELAEKHQAEMVVFGFMKFMPDNSMWRANIPIMADVPDKAVFSGEELKDSFRAFGGEPWTKLFNRQFLLEHDIKFLDMTTFEDVYLNCIAIASAQRICVLNEPLIRYRILIGATTNIERMERNFSAGLPIVKSWLQEHGKWDHFERDFVNCAIESILYFLWPKMDDEQKRISFNRLHDGLLHELAITDRPITYFNKPVCWFETQRIVNISYDEYLAVTALGCSTVKHEPELIVSLTSYPKRIGFVYKAIRTILAQSEKADRILLWLSEEEFPGREQDLPGKLLELRQYGLSIEWYTDDIGPYKKLIPTIRKYPHAVIATADDDVLYPTDWLKILWDSYQKKPNAIYCHRPAMLEIKNGEFCWTATGKRYYPEATYLHRGISHAGVLYPPHSLHSDVTEEEKFLELAPTNDDLWFWVMAIRNGTKIAVAKYNIPTPKYVDGTQDETLSSRNFGEEKLFERDFDRLIREYPEMLSGVADFY